MLRGLGIRAAGTLLAALLVLAPTSSRAQVFGLQTDGDAESLLDIEIPTALSFTVECGTNDCGVTFPENSSNPTAPASGNRLLHCKSDGCYILPNGGTATPGDKIAVGASLTSRIVWGGADIGSGDVYYLPVSGHFNANENAAADTAQTLAFAITISEACCAYSDDGTWDGGDTRVQKLYINSADSGFEVTLNDSGSDSGCDSTASDTTVAAGEDMYWESDETAGANAGANGTITCSIEYTVD